MFSSQRCHICQYIVSRKFALFNDHQLTDTFCLNELTYANIVCASTCYTRIEMEYYAIQDSTEIRDVIFTQVIKCTNLCLYIQNI